jgi:hypothetical protein
MLRTPDAKVLKFDTIALLAVAPNGDLDEDLALELIRFFRPDRDGNLTLLDFAKSIDTCYKELRLLRASVANSSKMDNSLGVIINVVFYIVIGCIVGASAGLNPWVVFTSVSTFFVGFAFMVSVNCFLFFSVYLKCSSLCFSKRSVGLAPSTLKGCCSY